MPKKRKITEISQIFKTKRLDKAIDYGLRCTFNDGHEAFIPIRITDKEALSFIAKEDTLKSSYQWVSIPKKRTINANAKAIIESYPNTLCDTSKHLFKLNEDDRSLRKRKILNKRKWKVHEFAVWPNGYFVARLSCSTCHDFLYDNTQFILYPTPLNSLHDTRGKVYTQHGSYRNGIEINLPRTRYAIQNEELWPSLSELLNEVEFGYKTAAEAEVAYNYILQQQEYPPSFEKRLNIQNSKRQHRTDKNTQVEILDHFKGNDWQAWVIVSDDNYFIAKEENSKPNILNLVGTTISAALKNDEIEDSAQSLISQWLDDSAKTSWLPRPKQSLDDCLSRWREMITQDLKMRYFSEQLRGDWIINEMAIRDGKPVAVKFQCLPMPSVDLPTQLLPLTYRMLAIKNGDWCEPVKTFDRSFYSRYKKEEIDKLFIDVLNQKITTKDKQLEDFLRHSTGYHLQKDIDNAFYDVECDEFVHLCRGVSPIQTKHKEISIKYHIDELLSQKLKYVDDGLLNAEAYEAMKQRLVEKTIYPEQLVDLAVDIGVCSVGDANLIKKQTRYNTDGFEPNVFVNKITENKATNIISTTEIRNEKKKSGRQRIHKDDRERKRVWAQKARAKAKQLKIDNGQPITTPGRKKIHTNNAEKQREYRLRQKYKKYGESGFLVVTINNTFINDQTMINNLEKIVPNFGSNVLFLKFGPIKKTKTSTQHLDKLGVKKENTAVVRNNQPSKKLLDKIIQSSNELYATGTLNKKVLKDLLGTSIQLI